MKLKLSRTIKRKLFLSTFLFLILGFLFYRELGKITKEPISSWEKDITADCAVVLTGGANRVREGFDLLSRKQVRKLIISGVYTNANLREIMPLWPFYGQLDQKDVVLERRSSTTYGNAQQSLPIVEALGCKDVALVTSNLHMVRAYQTFVSIFPDGYLLVRHSVNAGRSEMGFFELSTEVLKSLFYSLWVY